MMKRTKLTAIFLTAALSVTMLAGCGNANAGTSVDNQQFIMENPAGEAEARGENKQAGGEGTETSLAEEEKQTEETTQDTQAEGTEQTGDTAQTALNIGALKGPTAMGMAQLLDDEAYNVSIVASPDEMVPMIVQGQVDIAAIPANLSSVLYQKTEKQIKVLAANTLGVLYLVENGETIQSVEDVKGKTIYASGKGATPEYALEAVLTAHGIEPGKDVTVEFKSEHAEVVAALAADQTAVGLLPQPFVTTALMKNENLRVALDLNELWESGMTDGSRLVTGVVVVRNEFLEKHPEEVAAFMAAYEQSVEFVNSDVEAAAEIIGAHDIVTAEVAKQAIPECSIVYITGEELKTMLSGYLNILFEQNPQTVGGAVPDETFYYEP